MFWAGFVVGLFLGSTIGMFVVILCVAGKEN